jgi:hypothetical protein
MLYNHSDMYKMKCSIQNINNGALDGAKPMPLKDRTSDNQSSFNMSRQTYLQTVPAIAETVDVKLQKKWLGNRDASQITSNRRNVAVGKGSLNQTGNLYSFTTYKDINVTNDAIRRVRAGGSVAPPKKNARTTNAPTPTFAPIRFSNINGVVLNQHIKTHYGNNAPTMNH